jgi:hypothetical protein
MRCTDCGGTGCDDCVNGKVIIDQCPLEIITSDTWEIIDMADLYLEHGLPVVAGGQLDQCKSFMVAAKMISNENAYWKKKQGII